MLILVGSMVRPAYKPTSRALTSKFRESIWYHCFEVVGWCYQVFEEALKTWLERQKMTEPVTNVCQHDVLSHVENNILLDFVDAAESLIRRSVQSVGFYIRFLTNTD